VLNACVSRYLDLALVGSDGPLPLALLALDGGRFPAPRGVDGVLLAPGARAELAVDVPAGTAALVARPYDRGAGMMGMMGTGHRARGVRVLARLEASGTAETPLEKLPGAPGGRDLSRVEVVRARTLTLAMGMGGRGMMTFTIDGREFDADRVDQGVRLGDVEEWTLVNTSPMDHPFHLHVRPMQVMSEGGSGAEGPEWRDVVNVPAGGSSVVRIAFDRHPGRSVYHCHVLDHEDLGMMGVVDVA
jgi:FtsP/CotA-like multicopper oxidase with cupredoxin domain